MSHWNNSLHRPPANASGNQMSWNSLLDNTEKLNVPFHTNSAVAMKADTVHRLKEVTTMHSSGVYWFKVIFRFHLIFSFRIKFTTQRSHCGVITLTYAVMLAHDSAAQKPGTIDALYILHRVNNLTVIGITTCTVVALWTMTITT